jgi:uncharacterized membrane protein YgdD (TMEM256/DUF423 family)
MDRTTSFSRLRLTSLIGLLSIVLGALGAHGHIHDVVSASGYLPQWQTAVQYHQIHSLLLLVLALNAQDSNQKNRFRASFILAVLGIILFSGSLYVLSYTGIKILGAITPFGGLSLMLAWVCLLLKGNHTAR